MSNFSLEAIETLDYDFTGIASNSGKGGCKGKGTIPEPSQPRLEAYSAAMRELFDVKDNKDVADALNKDEKKPTDEELLAEQKVRSEKLLAITAELCQNTPSKAELEDLPPRYQRAFLKWIFREIADPEVLSAGTRR